MRRVSSLLFVVPFLFATTAIGPCNSQPLGSLDGGIGCDYQGEPYVTGDHFRSIDGCNVCTCLASGEVSCTTGSCVVACGLGARTDNAIGHIVFDSDRANFNRDIYLINANGSGLTRLTTETSIEKEPAVSPDGRQMTFTSDRGGSPQIYLMDLTSRAVTELTSLAAGADQSSFSHDGSLVAFHSGASVYTIHPDGTGLTLVASGLDAYNAYFSPRFSLDDQELVFDRNNEIDATALDGTGFRMIVQNTTTTIKAPSVSPRNGDVAYHAYCSSSRSLEGYSIWITPFLVKTVVCGGQRLTPTDEPASQKPAWGPNDVFAYERVDATSNVATIALIDRTPGSLPCILTPDSADSRNPTWSP